MSSKLDGGSEVVALRFNFYRDGLALSLAINVAQAVLLVVVFCFAMFFANKPPETKYFSVDAHGSVLTIVPMNEPHMSEGAILEFAAKAVSESYTFDADNYRSALMNVQKYFTPDGFAKFQESMQGQIKYVVDNVLITSTTPNGTPVLIKRGESDGVTAWRIRVPVIATYRTKNESTSVKRLVTLVIVNRPSYETPYGVGVSSFQTEDKN